MKKIAIYRPKTVDEAMAMLSKHGQEAGVYAGGTDLLVRLKNRLQQAPTYLVDIKRIQNLRYIREDSHHNVLIGATTRLSEIAESPLLKQRYPMLVDAVLHISSPELRNASTIGGDLLQEVWCQYLRGGYSCWRNGGYICYGAIGDNSYYHSAMGGRLCYAVYPGDAATALIPFDARARLATPQGPKELSIEQLVPGDMLVDGRIQSHVVRHNEILTEVILPPPAPGLKTSFEKLRPRGVWDFAMASAAISLQVRNNAIEDSRVVFGGISGRPLRETAVENFLRGKTLGPTLATDATTIALTNAAPLKYNAMKIEMAKGLLVSGLNRLHGTDPGSSDRSQLPF
jgi:xanthine dehydrogenase YagS FAD-binding subunit